MATYTELRNLFNDSDLKNKVTTATIVAAYNLIDAVTPTAADRAWAWEVFRTPTGMSERVYMAVLATNKDVALGSLTSASDATIQSAVDAVVPQLVLAHAGS